MHQIETIIDIQRPVEQVFAYLTDLRNMTQWAEGIVEVEIMTPGTTGAGTAYRIVGLLAGRRVATPLTIVQYEPQRAYTSITTMGPLIVDDRWEFTPSRSGTHVQQVTDMRAAGLLAPLGWLASRLLRKRLADDLRRAKRLLEVARSPGQSTDSEAAEGASIL